MIIYGTGEKKLLTERIDEKCPRCGTDDSLELTIAARFFHLFWIPFFPIGKKSAIFCTKCGLASEIPSQYEQINFKCEELKTGLRPPTYLFSGLVLTILVIVFFIFRGIEKDKRTNEYVHSPMIGDIYEIKTIDDYYSLLRIEEVFDDSVYVCFHGFQADRKSGLKELRTKKGWLIERYVYRLSDLLQMYQDGYILSVDRDTKIEDSGKSLYNTQSPPESESKRSVLTEDYDSVKTIRPQPAKK